MPNPNNPQSPNRYSYVFNNPLRFTDPTGRCPTCTPSGYDILLDAINAAASAIGDFFSPSSPPQPVFLTNPGIPFISPIQTQASANFFRPQITQAQRLGFSIGGLSGGTSNLAEGLFGLFGVTQSQLDIFQLGLSLGGAAPGVGFFGDITNFVIDLFAFDFGAAAIDSAAAFPVLGLGAAPFSIGRRAIGGADDTIDLFRAVSPGEFNDVFHFRGFRQNLKGGSLEAKQFGLNLDEVIQLGNHLPNAAAVIRARVPRRIFNRLDLTPVDSHILRSGSVSVQPDNLEIFNRSLLHVDQAF